MAEEITTADPVSVAEVEAVFAKLLIGDGAAFFAHVADEVDWTVMGTHPLAGRYRDKEAFRMGTFAKLARALPQGPQLSVTSILVSGAWAVVELRSDAVAKNGLRFDNRYCWVTRFSAGKIVEVRAYLDSALVQRLLDENPV